MASFLGNSEIKMAFITQIFAEGQSLVWLHEMRQLFSSSLTFGETETFLPYIQNTSELSSRLSNLALLVSDAVSVTFRSSQALKASCFFSAEISPR